MGEQHKSVRVSLQPYWEITQLHLGLPSYARQAQWMATTTHIQFLY